MVIKPWSAVGQTGHRTELNGRKGLKQSRHGQEHERASEASSRCAGLRELSARSKTDTVWGRGDFCTPRPFIRTHSAYSTDLQRQKMGKRNGVTGGGALIGGQHDEQATGRKTTIGEIV